ncbi:DUF3024 domain-containing protein [Aquisphaera insulae]|uniref:DUF3024 domain-containing protein n=1 Tax=Aquisphaera insulae TaxID=2712864 RepID=UPI0013EC40E7|nr:DUF3024 domain-containing protein [Aquisphaera insulae]
MSSNKPAPGRAARRSPAGGKPRDKSGVAVVLDFTLSRIEAFNAERGGGVAVRKDAHGYSLFRVDQEQPVARLRSRDSGKTFEILYWHPFRERWLPIGELGGVILPLNEALEYIARDPVDCFWR